MKNTPSAQKENPFEQFVLAHVKFDSKGHANVTSLHGLSKLLRWFYKEIIVEELKQERTRLLSVESMKMEKVGEPHMEFYEIGGRWIDYSDEKIRNELRQSILSDMEKGSV